MEKIKKMINCIYNYKNFDFVIYIAVLLISYLLVAVIGNHIGLYYDSINPEHLSPLIINNLKTGASFWSYPILGKVYHGCINAYVMAFILLFVSVPSSTLLHFISASYGAFISCIIYKILNKCNVDKIISGLIAILTCSLTALIYIYISQYYIELTGMVLEIIAINLFINWIKSHKDNTLFKVGILSSFACFGYYNYAFFVPAYISIIFFESCKLEDKVKKSIKNFMIYISGFIIGLIPYIIGYSCMKYSKYNFGALIIILIILVTISISIYTYKSFTSDINKRKYISASLTFIIILFCLFSFGPIVLDSFTSMPSKVNDLKFIAKIFAQLSSSKNSYLGLVSGSAMQHWIFKKNVCIYKYITPAAIIIIFLLSFIISIIKRIKGIEISKKILYSLVVIISYFLFSYFIALSALSPQHFVPFLFINMLILGFSIDYIINIKTNKKSKNKLVCVFIIILIYLIIINFLDNRKIMSELFYHGSDGAYSYKVDKIAYEALDNKGREINEIHIFNNWGFATSFKYLTKDMIPFIENSNGDTDINEVIEKYIDNYQISFYYTDTEKTNFYEQELEKYNDIYYEFSEENLRNGNNLYYKILIRKK